MLKIFLAAAIVTGTALLPAVASADPARDAILAGYLTQAKAEDPAFTDFSAERGQAFYLATQTGGKPDTTACQACHGADPRVAGKNVKTGKVIEPMAVSANPKRFTVAEDIEKWFGRNCKDVLGRACTAAEKGDYVTFLVSQ